MTELADLIARARDLAERLEHAADSATASGTRARPAEVQAALKEAVEALHLGERHKYEQVLRRIVDTLSPELGALITERGADVAHRVLTQRTNL